MPSAIMTQRKTEEWTDSSSDDSGDDTILEGLSVRDDSSSRISRTPKTPKTPSRSVHSTKDKSKKSSKSKEQKKKSITFNPKLKVTLVLCLREYTQEEIMGSWYQPSEYGEMEEECDLTSQLMEFDQPLAQGLCERGLECWTTDGEKIKEENVSEAVDIVWNAQIEIWKEAANGSGKNVDPFEAIAKLYEGVSSRCAEVARDLALKDESMVKAYLASARSMEKARRKRMSAKNETNPSLTPSLKKSVRRAASTDRLIRRTSDGKIVRSPGGKIRRSQSENARSPTPSMRSKVKAPGRSSETDTPLKSNSSIGTMGSRESRRAASVASLESRRTAGSGRSSKGDNSRKISYKPKSKSKIPLSPTNSMCSSVNSSGYRRTSVASSAEESTSLRRRLKVPTL